MKTTAKYLWTAAVIFLAVLLPVQPVFAQAPGGNPTYYPTWPPGGGAIGTALTECANIGTFAFARKVDPPLSGIYLSGGNTITVNILTTKTFNWSSTAGISAVIVKAGTAANVWNYSPMALSGTGLYAPENKAIGHITFCWNTPIQTPTATKTSTPTFTATVTRTSTPTFTATNTPTDTATPVPPTPTFTPTDTSTPVPPTPTFTPTDTGTPRPPTETFTPTATVTSTNNSTEQPNESMTPVPTNRSTSAATRVPDDPKEPTPPPSVAPATGAPGGPAPLIIGMVISTLLAAAGFVLWRKPVV